MTCKGIDRPAGNHIRHVHGMVNGCHESTDGPPCRVQIGETVIDQQHRQRQQRNHQHLQSEIRPFYEDILNGVSPDAKSTPPPALQGASYQKSTTSEQFQASKRKKGPLQSSLVEISAGPFHDRCWQISRSETDRCSCRSTPAPGRRHVPHSSADRPRQSPADQSPRSAGGQYRAAKHHRQSARCHARQCQTPVPAETAPEHFSLPEQWPPETPAEPPEFLRCSG